MESANVNLFDIQQGWLTFAITDEEPVIANVEDTEER